METKIIRNDRGLDFKRIEQFLKMFQDRCRRKSGELSNKISDAKKGKETEAFKHFGIDGDIKAIKNIDTKIEKLKEQRRVHEGNVRDFTQGLEKDKRCNSYDDIKEGSPIQKYIDEGCEKFQSRKDEVWALNEQISNELWYTKDLEQAIEIMQQFQHKLDAISLESDSNA